MSNFANSEDPDEMLQNCAGRLSMQCQTLASYSVVNLLAEAN